MLFCALATTFCGEQGKFTTGPKDTQAPAAGIVFAGGAVDTLVQADSLVFTAGANDNVSVAHLKVEIKSITIGFAFDSVVLDSAIGGTVTAVSRKVVLPLAAAYDGKQLKILVTATDGAGNVSIDSTGVTVAFADVSKPTITITVPTAGVPITVGDSVLVRIRVQDNRGVDSVGEVGIAHRGVDSLGTGTDVIRYALKSIVLPQSKDTTFSRYLLMVPTDSTPEFVRVIVSAKDSSGNIALDTQLVQIVGGPHATMIRPANGASTAPGKSVQVEVDATKTAEGILIVGFTTSGVYTSRDSVILTTTNGALPTSYAFIKTITIPIGTPNGVLTFTPFALDSLHNISGISPSVALNVSSAVIVAVPPAITYSVGRRVETGDSITIEATSPAGIGRVGFTAKLLNGTPLSADSTTPALNGTVTDYTQRLSLKLPPPPALHFPAQVVVQPFAYDSGLTLGGRAVAPAETLTVVAGTTYSLPSASQISDAIYDKNRNELYLANTPLDRIDVFSLTSNAFVGYVPVGSRPTSLAMWPRDTLGNVSDTLIVANSGGTNLSVVDLVSRRELWRQTTPNYQVTTVKTQTTPGGGLAIVLTPYEFSDRPYQVAAMCVTAGSAKCHHVRVLYSTTPTPSQTGTFASRGYLAWLEMDSANTPRLPIHMIYEHMAGSSSTDTLQILAYRDTIPGQPIIDTILGMLVGKTAFDINSLAFEDSTFVRNSGNALHAIVGEGGGSIATARALTYDVRPALTALTATSCTLLGYSLPCTGTRDNGISPVQQVTDFVVNRSSRVTGVAINYNGQTALVRADSIYAFDWVLKQTGMMQISSASGAVGMDFHPCNNFNADARTVATFVPGCPASYSPSNRMVFAARPDSSLDVFDTYFYGEVTDTTSTASTIPIPIRNALIGPVRVAATGSATIMFGFTHLGLVVVNLPTVANSLFPTPQAAPPPSAFRLAQPALNVRQH